MRGEVPSTVGCSSDWQEEGYEVRGGGEGSDSELYEEEEGSVAAISRTLLERLEVLGPGSAAAAGSRREA